MGEKAKGIKLATPHLPWSESAGIKREGKRRGGKIRWKKPLRKKGEKGVPLESF